MPETVTAQKTCLLTLVQPAHSDRVLKVFPAEHSEEKIFLNRRQGIDRWEIVSRYLENYAAKGTRVYKAVPWHQDPKDLKTVTLDPKDIPTVKLEDGAFLEMPPSMRPKPKADLSKASGEAISAQGMARLGQLEQDVAGLSKGMNHILAKLETLAPAKPKKGRRKAK